MLKVLHIIGSAHFGGIEKLVYDLSRSQKRKRLDVAILVLNREGEFVERFLNLGMPCYFSNLKSGFDLSFLKYIKIYTVLKQYDIVNIHSFNPILSFFLVLSNVKIVYTVHSVRGFGRRKKRFEKLKLLFQIFFFKRFVHFVTFNSKYSKGYWIDMLGETPNRVIYNGIDMSTEGNQNNETIGLDKEFNFIIGTSCRFVKWKRVDKLILVFKRFQEKFSEAKLLLVGDGTERVFLEKLAHDLGIEKNVIFTGFTDNVRAYQSSMDVCVFPSTTETFGLVAVETLLLGKPTLVFKDGGGITEIINGICKEDVVIDEDELLQRLTFYYVNRASTHDKEKRMLYAKEYNIDNMAEEFKLVYSQVMLNRKKQVRL